MSGDQPANGHAEIPESATSNCEVGDHDCPEIDLWFTEKGDYGCSDCTAGVGRIRPGGTWPNDE
jgi:hypothetical protein